MSPLLYFLWNLRFSPLFDVSNKVILFRDSTLLIKKINFVHVSTNGPNVTYLQDLVLGKQCELQTYRTSFEYFAFGCLEVPNLLTSKDDGQNWPIFCHFTAFDLYFKHVYDDRLTLDRSIENTSFFKL
uniref:Uncharacterized protein n=1 Tax=Romanomermis culicivorax TaxID=13658 RepID=A0A915ILM6_ROMCU